VSTKLDFYVLITNENDTFWITFSYKIKRTTLDQIGIDVVLP
jgi:hypothetical protein